MVCLKLFVVFCWLYLTGACAPEPATELLLSLLFLLLLLLFSLRCFGCFCCFRCCLCFVSCCFVSPRRPTAQPKTAPQMTQQRCQNGAKMAPKMTKNELPEASGDPLGTPGPQGAARTL